MPELSLSDRGLVDIINDRYTLRRPIRDFATSRLSERFELEATNDRLARWLLHLTTGWGIAEIAAYSEPQAQLVPEHINLDAALHHLSERKRSESLAWLVARTAGMWIGHGMGQEASFWLSKVLEDPTVSAAAKSAAAHAMTDYAFLTADFVHLGTWGEKSIELAAGEPHDWVSSTASYMAMWSLLFPLSSTAEEFLELAEAVAEKCDAPTTAFARISMRRAHVAHIGRDYETAVQHFEAARAMVDREGRLLLSIEAGHAMSLYLTGRKQEAMNAVRKWKSKADTDEFHFLVDIVRAIVVGGAGYPQEATTELAAAMRRLKPTEVWARADQFQTAFGLLADMRGERELSTELLATPFSGSVFLSSLVIEHLVEARGLDEDGFVQVAEELWSRAFPDVIERGAAATHRELVTWWESGTQPN